jgi:hypothetical protein
MEVKVKISLSLIKHKAVKIHEGVEQHLREFLTLALDKGEQPASCSGGAIPPIHTA